jgi:hypothetical protein
MRAFVILVIASACSTKPKAADITGTLVISGHDVSSKMQCRPGAAMHIFVDIVTPQGTLRFEDQKLSLEGEVLACDKLDRKWNGARRPDGTAYWRGTLAFDCAHEPGRITGDLVLACGNLTLEERAALDKADRELEEQKRRNADRNAGAAATNDAASGDAASGDAASGDAASGDAASGDAASGNANDAANLGSAASGSN